MKNNSDELKLLDVALADETWEGYQASLRSRGLATVRAARRSRTRLILTGQISALLILSAAVWWNLGARSRSSSDNEARTISKSHAQNTLLVYSHDTAPYITEEQMLAMFPKGSCVLAEINGQKQLVLLDSR